MQIVRGGLIIEGDVMFSEYGTRQLIASVQISWRVVCAHAQLNVMNKLYPVTLTLDKQK